MKIRKVILTIIVFLLFAATSGCEKIRSSEVGIEELWADIQIDFPASHASHVVDYEETDGYKTATVTAQMHIVEPDGTKKYVIFDEGDELFVTYRGTTTKLRTSPSDASDHSINFAELYDEIVPGEQFTITLSKDGELIDSTVLIDKFPKFTTDIENQIINDQNPTLDVSWSNSEIPVHKLHLRGSCASYLNIAIEQDQELFTINKNRIVSFNGGGACDAYVILESEVDGELNGRYKGGKIAAFPRNWVKIRVE